MEPQERDELLIRLDERSQNTWRSVEKIEEHLGIQNGRVRSNSRSIQYIKGGLAVVFIVASLALGLVQVLKPNATQADMGTVVPVQIPELQAYPSDLP